MQWRVEHIVANNWRITLTDCYAQKSIYKLESDLLSGVESDHTTRRSFGSGTLKRAMSVVDLTKWSHQDGRTDAGTEAPTNLFMLYRTPQGRLPANRTPVEDGSSLTRIFFIARRATSKHEGRRTAVALTSGRSIGGQQRRYCITCCIPTVNL